MKKFSIDAPTLARLILLLLALVNSGLVMLGYQPLPIDDDQVNEFVSLVFLIGMSLWSWWKNNNVTEEARIAQKKLKQVKNKKKYIKESGSPMPLEDIEESEEEYFTGGTL